VVEEPDEFSQPGDLVASQFENEQAAWRYIQERYTMARKALKQARVTALSRGPGLCRDRAVTVRACSSGSRTFWKRRSRFSSRFNDLPK
jgi:hypothetical protein